MNIANLSIKRPIFISCLIFLMLALGYMSLKKMPVDLFPNVTFPIVTVNTPYPGAGPKEVETLISKVVEEEISTLPGVKRVSSYSQDGYSSVYVEFSLETDVKYAEQQIRDRVSGLQNKLPKDAKAPVIRRLDPADQPVMIVAIKSNLPQGKLFDLANIQIKPKLEQINNVGVVEIVGGRKREIHVDLDRSKLKGHEISATRITNAIAMSGQNVPVGTIQKGAKEIAIRSVAEYKSIDDIGATVVNFVGNDVPIRLDEIATISDGLEDENSRAYVNGSKSIFLNVYRQSGSNTIAVVDAVKKQIDKINQELGDQKIVAEFTVVRDSSKMIHANVVDVQESILIGISLTLVVVYLFLGSVRSTIITSLALPNSLIGAFLLMSMAGFSINVMTLLALSLSVGLLIDDAIVVRENIFRHMEMGKPPLQAALEGTKEVMLAVIATTAAVISVFGPIGFLQGVVGQFFKEFGLTICFAMVISLFDALTVAPMLSAYFAGTHD
ncbi:efflux RND transporter permease subunit, partial [bacterium]|nr:efflux RND transporter permease subunit [bacterium]